MAAICSRWGEFTQLVANHVFCHKHRNVLAAVMHGKRVTDEVRDDRRATRPGLDNLLVCAFVHLDHLFHEVIINKEPFF